MKCPDCDLLEQKQRNYELAKKLVQLHKEPVVLFKDRHGYYRAALHTEFDPEAGTIIETLYPRRYTSKKL